MKVISKIESTVKLRIVNSDRVKKIAYIEYKVLYVIMFLGVEFEYLCNKSQFNHLYLHVSYN